MQEDLYGPCHQRAMETLQGFKPFEQWTAKHFLHGYYTVLEDNKGIACTLSPTDRPGALQTRSTASRVYVGRSSNKSMAAAQMAWPE